MGETVTEGQAILVAIDVEGSARTLAYQGGKIEIMATGHADLWDCTEFDCEPGPRPTWSGLWVWEGAVKEGPAGFVYSEASWRPATLTDFARFGVPVTAGEEQAGVVAELREACQMLRILHGGMLLAPRRLFPEEVELAIAGLLKKLKDVPDVELDLAALAAAGDGEAIEAGIAARPRRPPLYVEPDDEYDGEG